jgi:hypothetical protein
MIWYWFEGIYPAARRAAIVSSGGKVAHGDVANYIYPHHPHPAKVIRSVHVVSSGISFGVSFSV